MQEEFTLEDCEELLSFPYHEYISTNKQRDIEKCIPDSGIFSNASNDTEDISEADPVIESRDCAEDQHLVESCLSTNLRFQAKLTEAIHKLQAALQKNQTKREKFQKLIDENKLNHPRCTKLYATFSAPYFTDVRRMVAPENEDTKTRKARFKNVENAAVVKATRRWNEHEKENLRKGVYATALRHVLKPLYIRLDYLNSKLDDSSIYIYEKRVLEEEIRNVESDIQIQSNRPYDEIVSEAKDHVDWMEVSATYLDGSRDDNECEMMWTNYASTLINKKPFSREEDAQLRQLAEEHNERNWDSIAEKLQTGRSAFQCCKRFNSRLNKSLVRKLWTPEEDAILIEAVETCRIGKFILWPKVTRFFENRPIQRVKERYYDYISNEIDRSPWTTEEDAMLIACIKKYGFNFGKAKKYLVGRTAISMSDRFSKYLDPSLKFNAWSEEEDDKLLVLLKKHDFGKWKWTQIANEMPGRSKMQCKARAMFCLDIEVRDELSDIEQIIEFVEPFKDRRKFGKIQKYQQSIKNAAYKTLKSTLEKVTLSFNETIDLEAMDLTCLSFAAFTKLHEELIKKPNENRIRSTYEHIPDYAYRTKDGRVRFIRQPRQKYVEILHCGKIQNWLHRVLEAKFQEKEDLPLVPSYTINLNREESAECLIYKKHLQQLLMCQEDPSNDEENDFTFGGVDYKTSVIDTVYHFIHSSLKENQMIVLPPNCSTLGGFDIIRQEDSILRKTADFANHSIPYLRFLIGLSKDVPKCVRCCNVESTGVTKKLYDDVVTKMKSRLVIMDEDMRNAAKVETGQVAVQKQECCCKELTNSKDIIDLLTKRFLSLFLWPFLFSTVDLNQEQEKLLMTNLKANRSLRGTILCENSLNQNVRRKRKKGNSAYKESRKRTKSCSPYQRGLRSNCRNKDLYVIDSIFEDDSSEDNYSGDDSSEDNYSGDDSSEDNSFEDDFSEDDIVEDDITEVDIVEDDITEVDIVEDITEVDIVDDDITEVDIVEDDAVEDDIIEVDIVEEDIVKDYAVKDDVIEVDAVEDDVIE
ncbi:transcription factor MYB3R-5, partial [Nephila pilipes]